jgi:hypothetical protein
MKHSLLCAERSARYNFISFLTLAKAPVYILLIFFLGVSLYCISLRLTYPFELEWLENEMVAHGMMLAQGHRIYSAPATEFIAEIYPPGYYLAIALFFKLFDTVNFFIPRLISIAALAVILALLYRIIIKEGGTKSTGLLVSGFFLSFYEIHGTWFDLARADMLLYALLLLGLYVLAYGRRRVPAALWAALLLTGACYTKQTGLYFVPFAGLYLLLKDRKQCLIFSAALGGLLVSFFFFLQYISDGWFGTYVLFNPLRFNTVLLKPLSELQFRMLFEMRDKLIPEMRYEIFYKLPVFFTLVLSFVLYRIISITRASTFSVWECTTLTVPLAYFSIRPHPGSERNDFLCMTIWGCILLGLFLIRLAAAAGRDNNNRVQITVYLLLTLQLCLQLYNPVLLVPAPQDEKKGIEVINMVKNMPGEVYIPYHTLYGYMAGKKLIFNGGAYWSYQMLAKEPFRPTDLIEKVKNKYFSAIIIDDKGYLNAKGERVVIDNVKMLLTANDELSTVVAENYTLAKRIPYSSDSEFRTVTGFQTRPELILEPKKAKSR